MHFFVTGHTGFKGSWLVLFLRTLGHQVSGYALTPERDGLFAKANLENELEQHFIADVRDEERLKKAIAETRPDFAIHLAAQPLVLHSYQHPQETFTTNVNGTLNFLSSVSRLPNPPHSLVITTDKVYADLKSGPYTESDKLGGHDPYAASKAMADILTQSWAASYAELPVYIARAGNVIGAFDTSENRLIPDIERAAAGSSSLVLRNPGAVRPWQHVLDCLAGYLLYLFESQRGAMPPRALNFGPDKGEYYSVSQVLAVAKQIYPNLDVVYSTSDKPRETDYLALDSSLARSALHWQPVVDFESAVKLSLRPDDQIPARQLAKAQIDEFLHKTKGFR